MKNVDWLTCIVLDRGCNDLNGGKAIGKWEKMVLINQHNIGPGYMYGVYSDIKVESLLLHWSIEWLVRVGKINDE